MKQKFTQRIKDWWKNLSDEDRGLAKGCFIGSLISSITITSIAKHVYGKEIDDITDFACDESKQAYRTGVKDGKMLAYKDLLIGSGDIFNKLNMKVDKF